MPEIGKHLNRYAECFDILLHRSDTTEEIISEFKGRLIELSQTETHRK
jgi:hypothetical protein